MVLTAHWLLYCVGACSWVLCSRPDNNSCLTEEYLLSSENEEVQQLKYYLFSFLPLTLVMVGKQGRGQHISYCFLLQILYSLCGHVEMF